MSIILILSIKCSSVGHSPFKMKQYDDIPIPVGYVLDKHSSVSFDFISVTGRRIRNGHLVYIGKGEKAFIAGFIINNMEAEGWIFLEKIEKGNEVTIKMAKKNTAATVRLIRNFYNVDKIIIEVITP